MRRSSGIESRSISYPYSKNKRSLGSAKRYRESESSLLWKRWHMRRDPAELPGGLSSANMKRSNDKSGRRDGQRKLLYGRKKRRDSR
jgi:hypothetical protein